MEQFRPPHEVQRDTELALAFRDGDEDAVRTLYERFGGLVFTVAHRILGDGQRAEDVTQHVFLQDGVMPITSMQVGILHRGWPRSLAALPSMRSSYE